MSDKEGVNDPWEISLNLICHPLDKQDMILNTPFPLAYRKFFCLFCIPHD